MPEYRHSSGAYTLTYFDGWSVHEAREKTTLWRTTDGGAITVCVFQHREGEADANALDQCKRLLKQNRQDEGQASGDLNAAYAIFATDDGAQWLVRTLVRGSRFILATYNFDRPVEEEVEEARRTLASIELL